MALGVIVYTELGSALAVLGVRDEDAPRAFTLSADNTALWIEKAQR